ncbi:MAG: YgfZ/GcvT domain-containing protein [Ilumatobacteraceae bacterium]
MIVVDLPREALLVAGRDAGSYLHSQLSNDIASLAVGASTQSLVLEPTGRVVALVRVTRRADTEFVVDLAPGFLDVVAARLAKFKIRVQADISPLPVHCVALRAASSLDPESVTSAPTAGEGRKVLILSAWWCDGRAFDLLSTEPIAIERRGSLDDYEESRIAATWPEMGSEIVPGDTLPAATGVVSATVSFSKGCYPGQELVERMDSRGSTAPRTLRSVVVPIGSRVGDPFVIDGEAVGTITSVSGDRALAFVKRDVDV